MIRRAERELSRFEIIASIGESSHGAIFLQGESELASQLFKTGWGLGFG